MALPATDSFNGNDGDQLTTYSANWTLNSGDFDIQTNSLAPDSAGLDNLAHWNADTFNDDQYAEATLVAIDASSGTIGVSVRCSASTADGYWYDAGGSSGNNSWLQKIVSGSYTQLGSVAASAINDVLRIEAEGTTITPYRNGSTTGTPGAQTDASHSSGSAGVGGFSDNALQRIDDWEGGDLGAGISLVYPGRNHPSRNVLLRL